MPHQINISTHTVTSEQKKDLLGIYQDYLYFERGLEIILQAKSIDGLAYEYIKQAGLARDTDKMPWHMSPTDKRERDAYIRFVSGDTKNADEYTYISLYHTNKEQDVPHPKISEHPENYDFTTIDLDLPCLIERYAIAFPQNQKIKDAKLIIDGSFKTTYRSNDNIDMTVADALSDTVIQQQFRTLLYLVEIYSKNIHKFYDTPKSNAVFNGIMKRIAADETIAFYENILLDLLGSCADKTKEILRTMYPDKPSKDLWLAAEKDGLIASAENMSHFLNIRHLIRHQWDSLDNLSKYSSDGSCRNEEMRAAYLKSYHWIFQQNTLTMRTKLYQQFCCNFQPLIQILHPKFLAREKGESNSKFVQRVKQWQKDNPNKAPLISSNYLLSEGKHSALISNLKKVIPQAIIYDDLKKEDFHKNERRENGYFTRSAYLKAYSQIERDFALYCLTNGLNIKYIDMWEHLKKKFFTQKEYDRWIKYHQLRNNLSHTHLDEGLREDMATLINNTCKDDFNKLRKFLFENTPQLTRAEDGFFLAKHADGSVVKIDLSNNKIIAHYDKAGNDILQRHTSFRFPKPEKTDTLFKINYNKQGTVTGCRLKNGITIDLHRKKVLFPDDACIYFSAEHYNVFQFPNKNKIFTDKTFLISKYLERNNNVPFARNEAFIAFPKHKIKTDRSCRLIESCISGEGPQKLITQMKYSSMGSYIIFSEGTEINVSEGKFTISHNGIILNNENLNAFISNYGRSQNLPVPQKTQPTR